MRRNLVPQRGPRYLHSTKPCLDRVYSGPAESEPGFECPAITQRGTKTEEFHSEAAKATKMNFRSRVMERWSDGLLLHLSAKLHPRSQNHGDATRRIL
jgi:hypothetical protein